MISSLALALMLTACGESIRGGGQAAAVTSAETSVQSVSVDSTADQVWAYSASHPDGFTVSVSTLTVPAEGISVAYSATQDCHSREGLDYVISHSLAHDGYVGGWLNATDSLYYFDSVRIFPEEERERALAFARENGQIAVYVLSTSEEIRLSRVVHPHEAEPADMPGATRIFLAGTIDGGNSVDWQETATALLDAGNANCILYNPRQKEWHPEREGEMNYQVGWELEHLEKADLILMNFLPGSQSPITLLELGLFARSGKLHVVCPPDFYRYDNVRITCKRYGVPLYASLEEAVSALLGMKRSSSIR